MHKLLFGYLWTIMQLLIGYNLVLPLLLYSVSLFKTKKQSYQSTVEEADYAVIVTAYEQIAFLPAVIDSILKLHYQNFMIYIVADNCDVTDLHFKDSRVVLLRPDQALRSNVKSHFFAIEHFVRRHERITIIDSDNLVDAEYLNELNKFFSIGYEAVQGPRLPKTLSTTYAALDAARDIYYHFYDGKLLFELGSSATLAGSGMAFETDLYLRCMETHRNLTGAGFDKVLQAEIVARNSRIAFADKAIVFDEKTSQAEQLVNQRARWIHTWFRYFGYGFDLIKKGVLNRSINQFLFGLILLRPPLFIFLICSVACGLADVFIQPFDTIIWAIGLLFFITGFFIALIKSNTNREIYQSLRDIPKFMFYQVAAVLRSGDQKGNITTRHAGGTNK